MKLDSYQCSRIMKDFESEECLTAFRETLGNVAKQIARERTKTVPDAMLGLDSIKNDIVK